MSPAFDKIDGRCVLCGKQREEVKKLILGVYGGVCLDCVELCNDIMRRELIPGSGPEQQDSDATDGAQEPQPPFDNSVVELLHGILTSYGSAAVENQPLIIGLLRHGCPVGKKREIHALVTALTESIPLNLLRARSAPPEDVYERLIARLTADTALSTEAAAWAVAAWAQALARAA